MQLPAPSQQGVFDRADELSSAHHEAVMFCHDEPTGLRAIIGIHHTGLGPALGGTRFFPYRSEAEALTDVLRLSRGMTFKAAAAGMPLGGGKAVIIGDPARMKTPELLRAYGGFIDSLGGKYISAADVGTSSHDLDIIGQSTRWVVGRSKEAGGSGDSGYATALGVACAMDSAAQLRWGPDGVCGRTVGVEGAGKVGFELVKLLLDRGAHVIVTDSYGPTLAKVKYAYPQVKTASRVIDDQLDVYAPCALGGTLTPQTVRSLRAQVVCGAANNQLLTEDVDDLLAARDILWVPDYVANAGGLIQVGSELQDRTEDEVLADIRRIGATVETILTAATQNRISAGKAASRIVRQRLPSAAPAAR